MNQPGQWEEAIFEAARHLPPAQRAAYLDKVCAGDQTLRQKIEKLLSAADASGDLLAQPAAVAPAAPTIKLALPPDDPPGERVGDTVGRYKLLEKIGEGGFGVVYVAEQRQPVKRQVALKIIKLGMDTKQVVARFEAERQALAMMDHSNIARVFDAGTLENGRPYFVMELVRGIRITEYCDQNKLSAEERLSLFLAVCHALHHAHQKGIIHRDIKPSNILVTLHDGTPVPKVIDFGIAKATQGELTDKTVYTQLQQLIGTPVYMSPEQAEMSGLAIDCRSDIYSLGVLLYELLTGGTPFDQKELLEAGVDAMRKVIREKEPLAPSTRLRTMQAELLTTTAARRRAQGEKLIHLLRGDLDWIVMKCLEKDRTRRYTTAADLAADLVRHLRCEPVLARPASAGYRFRKMLRRNRSTVMAVVAALIGVLAGLGLAVLLFVCLGQTKAKLRPLSPDPTSVLDAH
jgi:serine/threonine protein kinase